MYRCDSPLGPEGSLKASPSVVFPCNASCINSTHAQKFKNKEASRDVYLSISLVHILDIESDLHQEPVKVETVLHQEQIHVWVKSTICTRDLVKRERRMSKGSVAQASSLKRKFDTAEANNNVGQVGKKIVKTETISKEEFEAEFVRQEHAGLITGETYFKLLEVLRNNGK